MELSFHEQLTMYVHLEIARTAVSEALDTTEPNTKERAALNAAHGILLALAEQFEDDEVVEVLNSGKVKLTGVIEADGVPQETFDLPLPTKNEE